MTEADIEIRRIRKSDTEGFHACLDTVARETQYILIVKAPPLERTRDFVAGSVAKKLPHYVAVEHGDDGDRIVGWADILPSKAPGTEHWGSLGMGLLPGYRGRGLGERLLRACMEHARDHYEAVNLSVYHDNAPAIALYEKVGFETWGCKKRGRKHEGEYKDFVMMAYYFDESEK